MNQTLRNTHPADALAAVRQQIKELEDREKILRYHLLTEPQDRVGTLYEATVHTTNRTTLDSKTLMENLPAAMWEPYLKHSTYETVKLKELEP